MRSLPPKNTRISLSLWERPARQPAGLTRRVRVAGLHKPLKALTLPSPKKGEDKSDIGILTANSRNFEKNSPNSTATTRQI